MSTFDETIKGIFNSACIWLDTGPQPSPPILPVPVMAEHQNMQPAAAAAVNPVENPQIDHELSKLT